MANLTKIRNVEIKSDKDTGFIDLTQFVRDYNNDSFNLKDVGSYRTREVTEKLFTTAHYWQRLDVKRFCHEYVKLLYLRGDVSYKKAEEFFAEITPMIEKQDNKSGILSLLKKVGVAYSKGRGGKNIYIKPVLSIHLMLITDERLRVGVLDWAIENRFSLPKDLIDYSGFLDALNFSYIKKHTEGNRDSLLKEAVQYINTFITGLDDTEFFNKVSHEQVDNLNSALTTIASIIPDQVHCFKDLQRWVGITCKGFQCHKENKE